MNDQPKWLELLEKYEADGLAEVPGPKSNPIILHWLQVEGGGKDWVTDDATPWCGATMAGIFTECGLRDVVPASPLLARSWAKVGVALEEPRVGAIAVLPRGSNPKAGHVGLVKWVDGKYVGLIAGNQGDKVSTVKQPASKFIAFRWPLEEKSPSEVCTESRIATAAARQKRDQMVAGGSGSTIPITPAPVDADVVPGPIPTSVHQSIDNILGDLTWAKNTARGVVGFADFVATKWWWIAGGIAVYFFLRSYWDAHQIQQWRAQDRNNGRTS